MDALQKLREQAAQFAKLDSPEEKMAFLENQKNLMMHLSPMKQLEQLMAVKAMAKELSDKIDSNQAVLTTLAA